MIEIDHVILLTSDLDRAAEFMLAEHGLASVVGGRHPGHGTGNRIIPMGSDYVELMAVVDQAEAEASPLGRWALEGRSTGLTPAAVSLRTDDIEAVARALGESPEAMSRQDSDGRKHQWRLAGLEGMLGPQRLPFFIQWDVEKTDHPARAAAPHRMTPHGISEVQIGPAGPVVMPLLDGLPAVTVGSGVPGVRSVTIATDEGDIVLSG